MARNLQTAGATLATSSPPLTAMPLTMAALAKPQNVTASSSVMILTRTDFSQYWQANLSGNLGGDPFRAVQISSGGGTAAATTSGYSASAWQHFCAVFAATNSRTAYRDGGSKGTDTTSLTAPTSLNKLNFSDGNAMGDVAEAGIWDVALSDADVNMLAKGFSPLLVKPGSLVCYFPLYGNDSPEKDLVSGFTAALSGSVGKTDHPRVFTPRRR